MKHLRVLSQHKAPEELTSACNSKAIKKAYLSHCSGEVPGLTFYSTMADQNQRSTYTQGHSNYTTATQERRTAEREAAFLLPHIKKTDHILDVGCGPGTITTGFAKYAGEGRIVGVDISGSVLEKAMKIATEAEVPNEGPGSVTFEEGNVLNTLPFPDESFDVVYCSQVFGYLLPSPEKPLKALAEIRRVLKPGGVLATRDGGDSHFYPRSCDLDRLWTQNFGRAMRRGQPAGDPVGPSMSALMRSAGFDGDRQVVLGASTSVSWGPEERKWMAWRAAGQLGQGDALRQSWLDAGIDEEEIQETVAAAARWADLDDAWHATIQCEVLAWK